MSLRRAAEMTWSEVAEAAPRSIALLPVGSTEAHGPHLPLATDVIISEAVCLRVADALQARGQDAVMFPAITLGLTEFARPFAGTISVSAEHVIEAIASTCRALREAKFAAALVINHHVEPAHFRAVRAGAEKGRAEGMRVACPDHRRPPWIAELGQEFAHGGAHAGEYETSLVMAAAPATVREAMRAKLAPVEIDLGARIKAGATDFLACGGPEAYFGHPERASAAEGKRLLEVLARCAVAALDALDAK